MPTFKLFYVYENKRKNIIHFYLFITGEKLCCEVWEIFAGGCALIALKL